MRILLVLALAAGIFAVSPGAIADGTAEPQYIITPVAEMHLKALPSGPLYWVVETFPTLAAAKAAAGPTSLSAEVSGTAYLFTLSASGSKTPGALSKLAEIGPIVPVDAQDYLLRINIAGGQPGAKSPVHTHAGTESFYVLAGQLSQKTPLGVMSISAGQSMAGHDPGAPMQVSSAGDIDLRALVMFVVGRHEAVLDASEFLGLASCLE